MNFTEHQLNAIVWAVWGQGTRRLVAEHPNGDMISVVAERLWRSKALRVVPEEGACPHWPAYRACAEPLVISEACGLFSDEPEGSAVRQFFQQLQAGTGWPLVRSIAQHADLDRIVEADVWPWLERESAEAQEVWRDQDNDAHAVGGQLIRNDSSPAVPAYRDQIEPLARIAYRLDEIGTQIAFLAEREVGGVFGERVHETAVVDSGVGALAVVSTIAAQQATYVRSCAVSLRNTAAMAARIAPSPTSDSELQWWTDLTTRPMTSKVRDSVACIGAAEDLAAILHRLAGESDVAADELGAAFEQCGWSRGIVAGASTIGAQLRRRADQITGG